MSERVVYRIKWQGGSVPWFCGNNKWSDRPGDSRNYETFAEAAYDYASRRFMDPARIVKVKIRKKPAKPPLPYVEDLVRAEKSKDGGFYTSWLTVGDVSIDSWGSSVPVIVVDRLRKALKPFFPSKNA